MSSLRLVEARQTVDKPVDTTGYSNHRELLERVDLALQASTDEVRSTYLSMLEIIANSAPTKSKISLVPSQPEKDNALPKAERLLLIRSPKSPDNDKNQLPQIDNIDQLAQQINRFAPSVSLKVTDQWMNIGKFESGARGSKEILGQGDINLSTFLHEMSLSLEEAREIKEFIDSHGKNLLLAKSQGHWHVVLGKTQFDNLDNIYKRGMNVIDPSSLKPEDSPKDLTIKGFLAIKFSGLEMFCPGISKNRN